MNTKDESSGGIEDRYSSLLNAMQHILSSQRTAAGHTQASMAKALGKSQPAVNKAENASPNVSLRILFEFVSELNLNLSQIFVEAERQSGIFLNGKKNPVEPEFSPNQLNLIRTEILNQQKQAVDAAIQMLSTLKSSPANDK